MDHVKQQGLFKVECWNEDWTEKLWEEEFPNGGTTAGFNDVLNTYFNSGTQQTSWFLGLIDNNGFSALATSDTMASHAGWVENTGYSAATRPQWTPQAPSGGAITNPSSVVFAINGTVAIKGAFIVSNSTKNGTTGVLWATGALSAVQNLVSGQNLKITYTCTLSALN